MTKRIIAFICVLALLLGTPIASVEAASTSDTYRVGFSKVDVTPTIDTSYLGLGMGGYGDQSSRRATRILTPQLLKSDIADGKSKFSTSVADTIPNNANVNMYHLYASCIAVTDQADTTVLLMTLDVINVSAIYSKAMREAVSAATGVPETNITITTTHTHSAPALNSADSYKQIDEWRRNVVTVGLVQAAQEAMANRSEATMHQNSIEATGTASVRHYYTSNDSTPMLDDEGKRHVQGSNFGSIYGSVKASVKSADEAMHLLMFKMKDTEKKDIVLCNYRAHPCRDSSSSAFNHSGHDVYTSVSSDYIGPMRDALEQAGYNFAYFQGSAGNIGTKGGLSSYHYGVKLAEYAISGLEDMVQMKTGPIQTKQVSMPADAYKPVETDIEPAQKVRDLYNDLLDGNIAINDPELLKLFNSAVYNTKSIETYSGVSYVKSTETKVNATYATAAQDGVITAEEAHNIANRLAWSYGLGSRYHANNILANLNSQDKKTIPLNAITLGKDIAIVTDPNELFDDLTQDLADYYGKRTFVFGYTNGTSGYLPNDAAFYYNAKLREDGTMAYGGSYETHVTDYAMGTGAKVATTMKNMLDSMKTPEFCPCVGTHTEESDCKEIIWEPWTSATSLPTSGNYYLTTNVTVSGSIDLQGTLNLDLKGMTIQGKNSIYTMAKGDHLVVTDSYAGGSLGISGIPIVANSGSKLTVYAGTIGGTIKDNGANVELWGTPSLYINMAKNSPAMDCHGLRSGAHVYVVGTLDQCFAKISSISQKDYFTLQNDYNSRYENGGLYLTSKQYHCVCAGSLGDIETDHVCELVSWQPWTKRDSLPTTTGNYYLTSSVYLEGEQAIEEGATVRLDLNSYIVYAGQLLDADGNRYTVDNPTRAYYVPTGSTLEITSTKAAAGSIDGSVTTPAATDRNAYGGVIHAAEGSVLRLYRGTITGHRSNANATAKRGGCVYAMGEFTMYSGTIRNGGVAGSSSRGGNVYAKNFTMYGGTIKNGLGTGINLYIDNGFTAHITGNAYIYSGISLQKGGSLKLSGAPHIPDWKYSTGVMAGITVSTGASAIDATGLDANAMAQPAPNGDPAHSINIRIDETTPFAKVSAPAQAKFFESYNENQAVHYDQDGNVSMYLSDTDSRYSCLCSGKLEGTDNHKACQILTWQPWTATDSLPTEGNYYLTANVAVTSCTTVTGELNLDLNGKTVTATGAQRVLDVPDGMTLRITDSSSGGAIDASGVTFEYEYTYANLGNKDNYGGVIRLAKGTFELYGGTLTGPANVARGGILSAYGTSSSKTAIVNIYGGTIQGGKAHLYGGSIYLAYATFKMYGGTIQGGSAGRGGNIYQTSSSAVTIKDGTIANGTASQHDYFDKDSTTGEYTVPAKKNAHGGNIYSKSGTLYVDGGLITGGVATGTNGNGGNLSINSNSTSYIRGGKVTRGSSTNLGGNIYVSTRLHVYGGEICDPAGSYNIGIWDGAQIYITNGKITGGTYAIYNGSSGGNTTLKEGAVVTGSTYGIYINDSYDLNSETGAYEAVKTHGTLTVDKSFTGTAHVYWTTDTYKALGVAEGKEIENTTATKYTGTGTLICDNLNVPLVGSADGKLVIANTAIVDGDGIVSYHPSFSAALEAYELSETSNDQSYIRLLCDQTDVAVTESIHLDLNGYDLSVASVADGCRIYGMDAATNQYTRYDVGSTDLCGKLTLANGISETCIVRDVHISLTKGSTHGTRKYLALKENGSYTFHRYYLSLNEAGLRPADAGIFYNAVFYGDEAIANAVTKYGVQVSTTKTFDANTTASSDYQSGLGAFESGVLGNKGYRTVLKGILSENGKTPVVDYSKRDIYGRAYIEVDGVTLYCSNTGATNLQSIIASADTSYGKNGLSAAQKDALDTMYNKYSNIMESWNILRNIGRIEIDIGDLFIKDPKKDDELNILLIGNSFSFYWVEELYGLLAEGSGYAPEKITVTNVYYSGCPLKNHWNWLETGEANYNIAVTNHNGRSYDKTVFYDLNAVVTGELAKSWDFISLQQNSPAFYNGDYVGDLNYARQTLEPYLGNLLSYLRSKHPKAEYMWHQFWSHEVGHTSTDGETVIVNNKEERTAFHDAMVAIGNEVSQLYNMTVVPTGEAWELVRDDSRITIPYSSTNKTARTLCTRMSSNGGLWDDLYHDGDVGGGQYLNACVWYEKITGKSVLDVSWTPTYTANGVTYKLTDEQVALLKYAAHAAVAKYTPNGDPS